MPLVQTSNRQYITIDKDEIAFKVSTPDGDMLSSSYEGYLVDVEWRQDDYKGNPANKYQFIFKSSLDENAEQEIIQSGESSVFSASFINTLLNIEGTYGKIYVRVWQPDGKDFIANWIEHNGEEVGWAYDIEKVNSWVSSKYNGDKTAFWRDMFEKKLKPKLEEQGTLASSGTQNVEQSLNGSDTNLDENGLDDLDDSLPF